MLKPFCLVICCLIGAGASRAADLALSGQSNRTYEDQAYDKLSLNNCSNITVRNCTFTANNGAVVNIERNCRQITIEGCDINGQSAACTGISMGGSYITIRGCRIHDIADDGIECTKGGDHWYFHENEICHLLGCGTDNGCGPCYNGHSDGFEIGGVDSVEVKRNLVYDVRSTSAFFMNNWSGGATIRDLLLENNIFYTPECGVVIYVHYIDGIKMYNNTFWKSNWLGIAIGTTVTRLEAYNNIAMNIDYNYSGVPYNAAQHKYDYNLVGSASRGLPAQAHDVVNPDPRFRKIPIATDNTRTHMYREVVPADFELVAGSPAIAKGTSGGGIPTVDYYGQPRTLPYDMGAIESENNGSSISRWVLPGLAPSGRFQIEIRPNPSPGNTHIRLNHNYRSGPVDIAVYSMQGELVRRLKPLSAPGQVTWDGRNAQGKNVGNGVYQVRMTDKDAVIMETVVLLR